MTGQVPICLLDRLAALHLCVLQCGRAVTDSSCVPSIASSLVSRPWLQDQPCACVWVDEGAPGKVAGGFRVDKLHIPLCYEQANQDLDGCRGIESARARVFSVSGQIPDP